MNLFLIIQVIVQANYQAYHMICCESHSLKREDVARINPLLPYALLHAFPYPKWKGTVDQFA